MAGMDLPFRAIRQQVSSAIDVIMHLSRMRDGTRRVVQVSEVLGMEGETILMQDIFTFEQSSVAEDGKIIGGLKPSGLRPRCNDKILEAGINLPAHIFGGDSKNLWR